MRRERVVIEVGKINKKQEEEKRGFMSDEYSIDAENKEWDRIGQTAIRERRGDEEKRWKTKEDEKSKWGKNVDKQTGWGDW